MVDDGLLDEEDGPAQASENGEVDVEEEGMPC